MKTKRNQLAHGEKSFKLACRDMTVEDIVELKDSVYEYLGELYTLVEGFLQNRMYLKYVTVLFQIIKEHENK